MLDTHDDLLPDVTSFCVTHSVVKICFSDDIGFIHVAPIASDAGFNPEDLCDVFAYRLCACVYQRIAQSRELSSIDHDIESIFRSVRRANNRHWNALLFGLDNPVAW